MSVEMWDDVAVVADGSCGGGSVEGGRVEDNCQLAVAVVLFSWRNSCNWIRLSSCAVVAAVVGVVAGVMVLGGVSAARMGAGVVGVGMEEVAGVLYDVGCMV
jgi:hypothetical protein